MDSIQYQKDPTFKLPNFTRSNFGERLKREAESWLGTPFMHQGRGRRGIDCLGLVSFIFKELGFPVPDKDGSGRKYRSDWYKHESTEPYLKGLLSYGKEVKLHELQVGDIVYFRIKSKVVNHGAVYIGNDEIIHAVGGLGVIKSKLHSRFWETHCTGAIRLHMVMEALEE